MSEHFFCLVRKSLSLSVVLHVLPYICYQLSHWHQSYCLKFSMDLKCHRESRQVRVRADKLGTEAFPRNVFGFDTWQVSDAMIFEHFTLRERFATGGCFECFLTTY